MNIRHSEFDFALLRAVSLVDKSHENWVKDSDSKHCLLCRKPFNLRTRRHHCRRCGTLVCLQCSAKKLHVTRKVVDEWSSLVVQKSENRVCTCCFNVLRFQQLGESYGTSLLHVGHA